MKITKQTFKRASSILACDDYLCRSIMVEQNDSAKTGDVLKQGTVYPTNDSQALGIIMHDVYLADNSNIALLIYSGTISKDKLSKLGVTVSEDAKKALSRITII